MLNFYYLYFTILMAEIQASMPDSTNHFLLPHIILPCTVRYVRSNTSKLLLPIFPSLFPMLKKASPNGLAYVAKILLRRRSAVHGEQDWPDDRPDDKQDRKHDRDNA